MDPALNGYSKPRVVEFMDRAVETLPAIPGVDSAALAKFPVLANSRAQITVNVQGYRAKEEEHMNPIFNVITPRYFATLGVPLVSGRDFRPSDHAGAPKGAIINETMAKYFFKNENPIGRRFGFGGPNQALSHEIVGVVKDDRSESLREASGRWMFFPYKQWDSHDRMNFYVRTSQPESAVFAPCAEPPGASMRACPCSA